MRQGTGLPVECGGPGPVPERGGGSQIGGCPGRVSVSRVLDTFLQENPFLAVSSDHDSPPLKKAHPAPEISEYKPFFGFGKSTGLGMFLVREILALTGITITETGQPEKSARFEIMVPKGGFRLTGAEE